ncbi:MAG: hypothetical protein CMM07_29240 [Rhodopirellula sp.]|nr:hypothetical protein [Rhodopirellula sp.]
MRLKKKSNWSCLPDIPTSITVYPTEPILAQAYLHQATEFYHKNKVFYSCLILCHAWLVRGMRSE